MQSTLIIIFALLISSNICYAQISKPDIIGPSAGTNTVDNIQVIWRLGAIPIKLYGQELQNPSQKDELNLDQSNILSSNIVIIPNPFSNIISVSTDQEVPDNSRMKIINLDGHIVKEVLLKQSWFAERIDLSDLLIGLYTLIIFDHNDQIISYTKISKVQ